jgi:phosphopantothenoylcysteine decarboxylase/phosphopantothenate--cysteine ligase
VLASRHIVLGVSGGVAAYKAVHLARELTKAGAEVRVVMTESASAFVGAASFAAVTGSHPTVGLFDDEDVSPHTALARWADAIVVAPLTASTLSRLASGQSSDALVATIIAAQVPVVLAPAMHTEMWEHPATRRNLATVVADGCVIVGPEPGELAGGDVGMGRMSEPETIVTAVASALTPHDLTDTVVLITAGGTREPIDPVRYIGNRSSGKMGNALASAAASRGANVILITSAPAPTHPSIEVIGVATAEEMAEATWSRTTDADIAILAAAVADFRPILASDAKIRRADGVPEIALEPTPDVLAGVVERNPDAFVVGFAAESGSLEAIGDKARAKRVDLLVANDVSQPDSGFGTDTNEVVLVRSDGTLEALPLMTKAAVAHAILDAVVAARA